MNIFNYFDKYMLFPICRQYCKKHIKDKKADKIVTTFSKIHFYYLHRYRPNFFDPSTFTEKLWNRMLFDRDPTLTDLSDKIKSREIVRQVVGEKYLVPLLWQGENVEEIKFNDLPNSYVIKTNHGAGYNIIVKKSFIDIEKSKRTINKWLSQNFCDDKYMGIAWGYRNIHKRTFIEEFIGDKGLEPTDYKFWCFNGRIECISLHFNRHSNHTTKTFDRNFNPHPLRFNLPIYPYNYDKPDKYSEMVEVVEALAKTINFIRVDLYCVRSKIYFGEFTLYPGGVSAKFLPKEIDQKLGILWNL